MAVFVAEGEEVASVNMVRTHTYNYTDSIPYH